MTRVEPDGANAACTLGREAISDCHALTSGIEEMRAKAANSWSEPGVNAEHVASAGQARVTDSKMSMWRAILMRLNKELDS